MVVEDDAGEGEGAGDVVVGDDQRDAEVVVDVPADLSEPVGDVLVGPALDGASETDADDLAENSGVHLLGVPVRGMRRYGMRRHVTP
ncbi:hypothetical protein TN53_21485 [Streptomyces sp. WM6386]|nr:hypothetical protein TN53_21485 [Streptomyces sp. WM6386]